MARFLALTSRGLFDVLEMELRDLGFETEKTRDGIYFESDWAGAYRTQLWLRTATRVIFPLTSFKAPDQNALYDGVKAIDFSEWINPDQTLEVEANIRDSQLKDQRYVALKTKDAIVDRFREDTGVRPSVDKENPDLRVFIRVVRDVASVGIDLSGETLSRRGYRKAIVDASLREHLAAALVLMTGWRGDGPFYDPMCGSGTIAIEAALIKANIAPGLFRKRFGFETLKNFDQEAWNQEVEKAISAEKEIEEISIFASDRSRDAIRSAQQNAEKAGVEEMIDFQLKSIEELENSYERGVVVANPPYGERIGDSRFLI
ncbi:MAG: RNA methyltransferase, partial [Bdellovibrionales bacterium]|nr:RNA methyltransferase [Bdellovibrionales bacterium]